MSRLSNTRQNMIWLAFSTTTNTLIAFLSRIVFMRILGEKYLGINSLFTSVIGIIAFADLGLASAFAFCFYKPISEKDIKKLQSLLQYLKSGITKVVIIIALLGAIVIPFLPLLLKGNSDIPIFNITLYYLVSLTNTLLNYWLMYKICYIKAKQEYYKILPFSLFANIITGTFQILALIFTRSYLLWALSSLVASLIYKMLLKVYISKNYPETVFDKCDSLNDQDKLKIKSNVKAMIFHKIGGISAYQTDSIIVSTFIGIATNGLLFNYEMIKNAVMDLMTIPINSMMASFGDLMSTEDKNVQLKVFYTMSFISHITMGLSFCGIGILATPFISLVFGFDKIIDSVSVFLICVGFYLQNMAYTLDTLPTAGGQLIIGAKASLVSSVINIGVSVIGVKIIGLPGIFIGTVISQLVNLVMRSFSIFKAMYNIKPYNYIKQIIVYFISVNIAFFVSVYFKNIILKNGLDIISFIFCGLTTLVIFILVNILFFYGNYYGKLSFQIAKEQILKIKNKLS